MSSDDKYTSDPSTGLQPMLVWRDKTTDYATILGRGFRMSSSGVDSVSIKVGTLERDYQYCEIKANPEDIEPKNSGLSLFDKVRLRFAAAAKNGTDVDLRFCTGEEATRKPEQDNLHANYGGLRIG